MTTRPRKTLAQLARESRESESGPVQIAGKPADVCPACGCVMFVDKVNRTQHEIVRYVECRNGNCGKRFLSSQPPAKLLREIGGDDDNSASGNPALTIVREAS